MRKPEDWEPGRYQWDRSFLWNLFHYKSVDYARFTAPGETEKIRNVLATRLAIGAFIALIGLSLLQVTLERL